MAGHINLQLGWPTPAIAPTSQLLHAASSVLTSADKSAESLVYGPDAGYLPLRSSIAKWLSSVYIQNEAITPDLICITNGASANLGCILQKFTEPGYTRNIWMIEPSYFLACPIFVDNGFKGRLKGVPEDEEGLDVCFLRRGLEEAEKKATQQVPIAKTGQRYPKLYKHIIYAVPTFSNPSAKTMSFARRLELTRLAREYDALVVTDDVYDVLRWPASPRDHVAHLGSVPPRIVDIDRVLDGGPRNPFGNAVSNGSFSKIIAPGMRVGWAQGTPAFSLALSTVGSTRSGGCPTQISASIVHEMIKSGELEKYLAETVIPTFRERYYTMIAAIKNKLEPLGFKISVGKPYERDLSSAHEAIFSSSNNGSLNGHLDPVPEAGGYFIYVNLPSDLANRATELAAKGLSDYNLKFAYGGMFQVEGDLDCAARAAEGFGKGLRLSWAWHSKDEIEEGVQRMERLVKDIRDDL